MEQYSRDFYSAINKSITPWLPSFAKIDDNEAISYFDKQLRGSLMVVIEGIQSKIEKNIQDELSSKEQDNIEFFNSENNLFLLLNIYVSLLNKDANISNHHLRFKNKKVFDAHLSILRLCCNCNLRLYRVVMTRNASKIMKWCNL